MTSADQSELDSEFDRDTAVRETAAGEYAAELADGWRVGGGINGGYQLAVVGRAIAAAAGPTYPHPFVVTAHYLSAGRPGPASVRTRVIRLGGSLATVEATLVQQQDGEERIRLTAVASYGDLGNLTGDVRTTAPEPDLPDRDRCLPTSTAPDDFQRTAPFLDRFELLGDPATLGWSWGEPSGGGRIAGWFRLPDREMDPLGLLLAVDALPPVTFDLGLPGWAPTLELSVHIRALPAPGWLKVQHATRNLAGGYFEEDCEVWDSAGRLVAQSRQLAAAPRTKPGS